MNGFVIELRARFALMGEHSEETIQRIFNNIDLNESHWEYEVLEELTEEEFDEVYNIIMNRNLKWLERQTMDQIMNSIYLNQK